jgi:hypothetical protein
LCYRYTGKFSITPFIDNSLTGNHSKNKITKTKTSIRYAKENDREKRERRRERERKVEGEIYRGRER